MDDFVQCLIEGGRVIYGAPQSASKEADTGSGFALPTNQNIWSGETSEFRQSFWDLLKDIMKAHDYFFRDGKDRNDYFIFFGFHVTDEPMSWEECELARDMTGLGVPTHMSAWDCYSDLTGYLWTNYNVEYQGRHDPWKVLCNIDKGKFLTLKFSITRREK